MLKKSALYLKGICLSAVAMNTVRFITVKIARYLKNCFILNIFIDLIKGNYS